MKEQDFFKYSTPSAEDKDWGLYLSVTGSATIKPGEKYPPSGHPSAYSFDWESGRVLQEYQINYITDGSGEIETPRGLFKIQKGTVLLLFPGTLHRYKPDLEIGWTEHYIGFRGEIATKLFEHPFFEANRPVIEIGYHDHILELFQKTFEEVRCERSGYQQVCSGLLMSILGNLVSVVKNKDFVGTEVEKKIHYALVKMRDSFDKDLNPADIAKDLNISYSYFRKVFTKYTKISPGQYMLLLKIQKAHNLLVMTSMSIKEIAYDCGFPSIYYFSRLFKQKHGYAPSQLRNMKSSRKFL